MKTKKFLRKLYHHKYGTGSTFYLKDDGIICPSSYVEYRYDALAQIHSLYVIETKSDQPNEILHRYEMPASLLINPTTHFIVKNLVPPKYDLIDSDLR